MFKLEFDPSPKTPSLQEIKEHHVLTSEVMAKIAKLLQDAIHFEIRRAQARARGLKRGDLEPVGLPQDPKFAESFTVQIRGHVIEVVSSWPTAKALIEGKRSFPMRWLVRSKVRAVPMEGPFRTTVFRTTPLQTADAWIHPGFKKTDFLDLAFERAMKEASDLVIKRLLAKMASKRYL